MRTSARSSVKTSLSGGCLSWSIPVCESWSEAVRARLPMDHVTPEEGTDRSRRSTPSRSFHRRDGSHIERAV